MGSERPQEWLDKPVTYAAAGVLVRLTGLRGWPVWVLPDVTEVDAAGIERAHAFRKGGTLCKLSEVYAGELSGLFPAPRPPADPKVVAALSRYVASVTPGHRVS